MLSSRLAVAGAALICVGSAAAQTIVITKGAVLPITFQDSLSLQKSREGDRFAVKVQEDRELPDGTMMEGRVVRVVPNREKQPGFLDLELNYLVIPGVDRVRVRALPIRWDERNLNRGSDGRFTSKKPISKEKYVTGGLLGGLVLGSILKKPFEGAFLGSLAGIILAETDDNKKGELVIRKGDKYGAYFERRVEVVMDRRVDDREVVYEGRLDRSGDRNAEIRYEGRALEFSSREAPIVRQGVVMVPLQATADQLGMRVDRLRKADNRDLFLIEGDRGMARLNLGLTSYRLNGDDGEFEGNPFEVGNVVYVPLEIFEKMAKGKFDARNLD